MEIEELRALLYRLIAQPKETEWIEFKENNSNPEVIGENLSALSNSAKLVEQQYGYLIYGVENSLHEIVGTTFLPSKEKTKGQEWKMWITQRFNPRIWFDIFELDVDGKNVSIIRIPHSPHGPLTYNRQGYIRIGSCNSPLWNYRDIEKRLWTDASDSAFEGGLATIGMPASEVLSLLDSDIYFDLLGEEIKKPSFDEAIMAYFLSEGIVHQESEKMYAITNVGAILLARSIKKFPELADKTARLLIYDGKGNLNKKDEQEGGFGYARAFSLIIKYIMDATPKNEVFGEALRRDVKMYPIEALRELLANAFVHQDFTQPGRPTIEIYSDRIEFTNPGQPRVSSDLWIVESVARNERLANLLKKLHVCEKRGSGIRRVFFHVEIYQLPAPRFTNTDFTTKATLYAYKEFAEMDRSDRTRACYQHCCLQAVQNEKTTNTTVRKRFGIAEGNTAQASRIINDTLEEGLIQLEDPENTSFKYNKYIPWWAAESVIHNENADSVESSSQRPGDVTGN